MPKDTTLTYRDDAAPVAFTRGELDWRPWLAPLTEAELTERHWAGLVDKSRSKSGYFMLLARDPDVLGARTRTDKDIFYNPDGGLPRAERELAATAVSRTNGCIFCASVHARFAVTHSKRHVDVDRLLDDGVTAPQDARWSAVVGAAAALTQTPSGFTRQSAEALIAAGFQDDEIVDLIFASAFFNWANRLMLSLGEPQVV
ncbi:alkylhydroperoxidase domain protein [Pannonibacter tanglangensis]|uniref:Alkylhydroperoxidase domain protein n=1 Tax=Pannonibacter tanglangensis TaxID=2750084 RepID=A0ABW9ZJA0_9HYPH|nr:alkylhydroperoxidase domain protein [Pannonibacter sp. XCT-34]NBN64773.1 alkylhydroperoxidase domain protein [Pannonibacter sp. XCT-34]